MNFARIKRRILLDILCWTAAIAIFTAGAYYIFKVTHKSKGSLYDEIVLIMHYCSYLTQNIVYLCVIKEYTVLLSGLIGRYKHINNLLR